VLEEGVIMPKVFADSPVRGENLGRSGGGVDFAWESHSLSHQKLTRTREEEFSQSYRGRWNPPYFTPLRSTTFHLT